MQICSALLQCCSTKRLVKCRKTRGNLLLFASLSQILLVSVIGEAIKFSARADRNNIVDADSDNRSLVREPRFISFDSSAGKIDIDLDLSIPFLSIPLQNKRKHATGFQMPFVTLNTKALAVFGTLMAIITFVIPLLFKEMPNNQPPPIFNHHPNYAKEHKRSDRGLDDPPSTSYFGDSLNEILKISNNLAPCIERLVCSAVATAKHADEPTSFDIIIDTLSSHRLFDEVVNGTVIKEAAAKGRQVLSVEDCATVSTECAFNQKILLNVLKIIGL